MTTRQALSTDRSDAGTARLANVTHVVENLNRGGLERVVIDLVHTQQHAGHACQVVCVFEPGSLAGELAEIGVPVIACRKDLSATPVVLWRLRRAIARHGGILHTHNATGHYFSVLASIGVQLAGIVSTRHGQGDAANSRRERLYRMAMGRTDAVVAVSSLLREHFLARGLLPAERMFAVTNGIDVDRFPPASADTRLRLRRSLGLTDTTRIIGTVGRLNWAKDQATLIRAFARLRDQRDDVALVLVGDGELRGALEQQAADEGLQSSVRFLGDRGDVADLLSGFDIFAMSSIREGYSIALLEACAAALPIVATDVGGNVEIVREGVNGRLVPMSDSDALTDALAQMLVDPEWATTLGAAGRNWVLAHASLTAVAARYDSIYAKLAARGRVSSW